MVLQSASRNKIVALILAAALVISLVATSDAIAASSTVRVAGDTATAYDDPGGWLFNRDQNNATPVEFNFDEASIGNGSLYVEPLAADPARKFIGEHFIIEPIDDVGSISYDFLIGSNGLAADANEFYMNVYANFDDSLDYGHCVYNVVPAVGSTTEWTTVTFDPDMTYSVRTRGSAPEPCPGSPSELPEGATIRMIALNLGDTSANDIGLDGYFDNVAVTVDGMTTVYDFEPDPETKNDCKNGGYEQYGFKNQGQCIRFVNTGLDSR